MLNTRLHGVLPPDTATTAPVPTVPAPADTPPSSTATQALTAPPAPAPLPAVPSADPDVRGALFAMDEYAQRLLSVRERMARQGLSALLV
ncbi:MAG TPA: hypothetical protein VIG75_05760, partial [Citricoccus sp.]